MNPCNHPTNSAKMHYTMAAGGEVGVQQIAVHQTMKEYGMIGLYFIFLLGCWAALVAWLSVTIARRISASKWRPFVGISLFIILLPLVLIDEIVGKYQFEQLCQKYSKVYIVPDAKGRTVYLANTPVEIVTGAWVNIVLRPKRFVDVNTGDTIVSYKSIRARGGWLMRTFFWGEPILYTGTCGPQSPPVGISGFNSLGITYIEPPKH